MARGQPVHGPDRQVAPAVARGEHLHGNRRGNGRDVQEPGADGALACSGNAITSVAKISAETSGIPAFSAAMGATALAASTIRYWALTPLRVAVNTLSVYANDSLRTGHSANCDSVFWLIAADGRGCRRMRSHLTPRSRPWP